MGIKILIVLAIAFTGAIVAMLVSSSAKDITLATTKHDNTCEPNH